MARDETATTQRCVFGPRLRNSAAPAEDLVDDVLELCRRVDRDTGRDALPRLVPPDDEGTIGRLAVAPLLVRPRVETPVQGREVDLEDEDGVERVEERGEVPRPAAEEGDVLLLVGDEGADLRDVPDVVVAAAGTRVT